MKQIRLRQSEIATFDECRRKHKFQYGRQLVPQYDGRRMPASGQRDIGTIAHVGIEQLNLGGDEPEALGAMWAAIQELRSMAPEGTVLPELDKEGDPEWWNVWRYAQAMVSNYVEWTKDGNDVGLRTIAVEYEFEVEVCTFGDFVIVMYGKIDHVFDDPILNGYVVRDAKTVQNFSDNYRPQDTDFQLRNYAFACSELLGPPRRAEHLMMKRVLGTGKAQPPFFERHQIPISGTILKNHHAQLQQRVIEMVMLRDAELDDPRLWPSPTKDCNWKCDYKHICPMVDDGSDYEDMIDSLFITNSGDDS